AARPASDRFEGGRFARRAPLGIHLQDGPALLPQAFAQSLPESGPFIQPSVEDGSPRSVVKRKTSRQRTAKHRHRALRPATLRPQVAGDRLPPVARFQAAPGPRLEERRVARPRNESIPAGGIIAGEELAHATHSLARLRANTTDATFGGMRLAYWSCASM